MKTIDLFGNEVDLPVDKPREYDQCQLCGRPLSNFESRRLGIGPECRKGQETGYKQTKLLLEDYYTGLLAGLPDPREKEQ